MYNNFINNIIYGHIDILFMISFSNKLKEFKRRREVNKNV